jgi:twitching motility protein PilJ
MAVEALEESMALDLGTGRKRKKKANDDGLAPAATGAFGYTELGAEPAAEPPPPRKRAPAPPTQRVNRTSEPRAGARLIDRLLERLFAIQLPWISSKPVTTQVQVLLTVMGLCAVIVVFVIFIDTRLAASGALQTEILGDTLMHTQRLAKGATNAVGGNPTAIQEVADSRDRIAANLTALADGDSNRGLSATTSPDVVPALQRLIDRWRTSEAAASVIVREEKSLIAFGQLIRLINEESPRLLQLSEEIAALKLQQGATPREIAASSQLVMLTQRLGRNANSLIAADVANAEVALGLSRDINLFRDLTQALLAGSEPLRIPATTDADTRNRLQELARLFGEFQKTAAGAVANLQAIVQAKDAEQTVLRESEALRQQVTDLQRLYQVEQRGRVINFWAMGIFGLGVLLAAFAIAKVLLDDTRGRAAEAEDRREEAMRLEDEAKRTNEQNQAAILRLMNELQEVADGNLTVQATVTEDITGAIADSVNYTVEELRGLVGRINVTAEQVSSASTTARDIATRLLTASEAQSREIRDTGEKVLRMAVQINDVSRSAGESAKVARTSLEAAERGQRAVYNQIAGMNEIREQIQETAKRIKRLGESSQEIGEIVELISDITEQTNVLALNAAIQAASAGEAGRGFSVVAEEVQRLADRSAEAAKQIGALVRTIQTDTQDAVTAMEKSTQGVVEGTKLSDAAGTALADIGRVSRQLAELIERISGNTQEQAQSAGGVAESIERILAVTDQTSQGTRQAAQSIGQLATLARELKSSVARFRVG